MERERAVRFELNGESLERRFPVNESLLNVLRYELGATEVKNGCEKGDCGACVVLVDGQAENTCCMLAVQAEGKSIETVKGMGNVDSLAPLQQAVSMFQSLSSSEKRMIVVPGAGHNDLLYRGLEQYFGAIRSFVFPLNDTK